MSILLAGVYPWLIWSAAALGPWRPREATWAAWRRAWLLGTLTVAALLAWATEILSALHALRPEVVRSGLLLAAFVTLWGWRRYRPAWPRLRPRAVWLAGASFPALALLLTGVQALLSPPNTPDALAYHLGRVIHWAQNHDVGPYPTHILRQLYQMPWAEEMLLWLRLTWGYDAAPGLVQWFGFGALLVLVYELSTLLAPRVAPWWSVWATATLPMVLLQAASTQNDLVVSYWIALAAWLVARYAHDGHRGWALAAAMALGLALRTKATAFVWAWPWGLWLLLQLMRRRAWRSLLLATLLGSSLIVGPLARNTLTFGHPLGGRTIRGSYLMARYDAKGWLSNALRDTAMHFALPRFLLYDRVERAVYAAHRWLDLDESHPDTTWGGYAFHLRPQRLPNEDTTGNPFHLFLLLIASGLLIGRGPTLLRKHTLAAWLAWATFTGVLRWQPWIVRLQLPWFVLLMLAVGWMLGRAFGSRLGRPASLILLGLLLLQAWRPLLLNDLRPLAGPEPIWRGDRLDWMFKSTPAVRQPYREALAVVQATGCDQIGLLLDEGAWEYPWWYALAPRRPRLRLEHVQVANPSARFAARLPAFSPCVVIVSRTGSLPPLIWSVDGQQFRRRYQAPEVPLAVYVALP